MSGSEGITLYKHRIFSLHGPTGELTANASPGDTVLQVTPATLNDVTIAEGSVVVLVEGVTTSQELTITAIDSVASTLTVAPALALSFTAAGPTVVQRIPHWAYLWTESPAELTVSPEDPSHPVQPGSASTVEVTTASKYSSEVIGLTFNTLSGQTLTNTASWDYVAGLESVRGKVVTSNDADTLDLTIEVPSLAGTLSQAASLGDVTLNIDSDLAQTARPSQLCFTVIGGVETNLGRVTAVDAVNRTLTLATPLAAGYALNTAIQLKMVGGLGVPIPPAGSEFEIVSRSPAYALLEDWTKLTVTYTNAGVSSSRLLLYCRIAK